MNPDCDLVLMPDMIHASGMTGSVLYVRRGDSHVSLFLTREDLLDLSRRITEALRRWEDEE